MSRAAVGINGGTNGGGTHRPARLLKLLLAALVLLWILPQLIVAPFLAGGTLHPSRRALPEDAAAESLRSLPPGSHLEEVSLTAGDGAVLRAWYVTSAVDIKPVVILLHGLGDNRTGMLAHARYLLADGHPVLLPDARGQGESGGSAVTYGVLEADDLHRWVALVQARHPGCVEGLGESLGAAELLQAASAFCAVVAEAPFESFREIATDRVGQPIGFGPWFGRTVLRFGLEATVLYIRWRQGIDLNRASPVEAIRNSRVPVLLIHGDADNNISRRHCLALLAADPAARLIDIPGAGHTLGLRTAGKAFETLVLGFLDQAATR